MRIRLIIAAATTVAAVTACGGAGAPSSNSSSTSSSATGASPEVSHSVAIKNFAYSPASLTVVVGTTVTWTNSDPTPHTTTADTSAPMSWDSGNLTSGQSYAVTFSKPGTYAFHCSIHNYMTGTIKVTG